MYEDFALFYDSLNLNANYPERTKYLCKLFEKFDRMPTLLLDLACGSGGFSLEFAKRSVSVIGVDISPDMLNIAREKTAKENLDILYLCQSANELDLYGTVDGAICCLDSLNHILDYEELKESIAKVSLFLEKDRLFIFDVNTEYKHREILGNNSFVIENDEVFCSWQNEFFEEEKSVDITLDFFVKDNNNDEKYTRYSDYITERAYTEKELENAITSAGLEILGVFDEMTFDAPKATCQRAVYVTKKV